MTRRGDVEHTYQRYVRELRAGVDEDRRRYLYQELGKLWWQMNEQQRGNSIDLKLLIQIDAGASRGSAAPTSASGTESEPEPEQPPADNPELSSRRAEDEEARKQWEAEVDARIAAAQAAKPAGVVAVNEPELSEKQ